MVRESRREHSGDTSSRFGRTALHGFDAGALLRPWWLAASRDNCKGRRAARRRITALVQSLQRNTSQAAGTRDSRRLDNACRVQTPQGERKAVGCPLESRA